MELNELLDTQYAFDEQHGWVVDRSDAAAVLRAVTDDVVGLVGELGEFSNIVKRLNLELARSPDASTAAMASAQEPLSEELIDTFIYLVRIAAHLKIDLEASYLKKLDVNRERYKHYQR